ncbi:MAG: hypothetical protein QOD95_1984 [Gammaproteobacteria bacterium]|nr:hypothetical protein [Gammaproteobacteria bacterium]
MRHFIACSVAATESFPTLSDMRRLKGDRQLTLRKFASLCSDNVLVEQVANLHGRNIIGFSHHLDYAASRLDLTADFETFWDSPSAERDLSLILRPTIDLLLKDAWLKSPDEFWSYLNLFSEHEGVAAIAKFRRSDEGPRAEKLPPLPRRSRSRDVASLTSAPRPTRLPRKRRISRAACAAHLSRQPRSPGH